MVLLGAGGVGKSAVAWRFLRKEFIEKVFYRMPRNVNEKCSMILRWKTVTIRLSQWIMSKSISRLLILQVLADTCETKCKLGHEEYSPLREQYIKSADGFLLIYSVISSVSFNHCQKLRKQIVRSKGLEGSPLAQFV